MLHNRWLCFWWKVHTAWQSVLPALGHLQYREFSMELHKARHAMGEYQDFDPVAQAQATQRLQLQQGEQLTAIAGYMQLQAAGAPAALAAGQLMGGPSLQVGSFLPPVAIAPASITGSLAPTLPPPLPSGAATLLGDHAPALAMAPPAGVGHLPALWPAVGATLWPAVGAALWPALGAAPLGAPAGIPAAAHTGSLAPTLPPPLPSGVATQLSDHAALPSAPSAPELVLQQSSAPGGPAPMDEDSGPSMALPTAFARSSPDQSIVDLVHEVSIGAGGRQSVEGQFAHARARGLTLGNANSVAMSKRRPLLALVGRLAADGSMAKIEAAQALEEARLRLQAEVQAAADSHSRRHAGFSAHQMMEAVRRLVDTNGQMRPPWQRPAAEDPVQCGSVVTMERVAQEVAAVILAARASRRQ